MNRKQLQTMLRQAQKMQAQLEEEMDRLRVQGSSGGGMVTVTMNGKKELQKVQIDPAVLDSKDVEMLEDLILAAFSEAARRVDEKLQAQMEELPSGLLGGI